MLKGTQKPKRKEERKMEQTVWYRGTNNGLYYFEELKLIWMEENPKERFDLGNFNAWLDEKGFVKIN